MSAKRGSTCPPELVGDADDLDEAPLASTEHPALGAVVLGPPEDRARRIAGRAELAGELEAQHLGEELDHRLGIVGDARDVVASARHGGSSVDVSVV
jgi:hypothetical protein